ncbi:MAG: response regulator [Desulfobacterales bacterium]|nr:response regulator [Desulfobacterales bacterium]
MKTVLIAEDDRILSKRIERALAPHGDRFAYRMVTDGQAAIAVLEEEPIDLVVTDIQMPRMNGLVLLAYIHTYHAHIPCIVTSAYGTSRMRAKVPQEVLRFFIKPYDPADLAQSILSALQREVPPEMPDGLRLLAFLNMIEMEQISCGFRITAPGCPDATLYFDNGILIDAQRGEMTGEAAFYDIMKGEIATYTFVDMPPEPPARTIHADLGELIRNAVADDPETELFLV